MVQIGYHASHEQFAPSDLLRLVKLAAGAGFDCAMSSDHFKPWGPSQGHSGFAWSWLGSALEATSLPFGVISALGYRYHPAIIAQAAATLSEMYPDRLWWALGSGQRLNEDIVGLPWPEKAERNARLQECASIVRALFRGENVTHRGRITVVDAKLFSLPQRPPRLLGAAVTEESAAFVGGWADGLLTVSAKPERLKKVVDAFHDGGGAGKPMVLQVTSNWAPTEDEALHGAFEQWRYNALGGPVSWELRSPEDFDVATRFVQPADLHKSVLISSDLGQHAAWLNEFVELGFDELQVHQVGRNQQAFIEAYGGVVLPQLRRAVA